MRRQPPPTHSVIIIRCTPAVSPRSFASSRFVVAPVTHSLHVTPARPAAARRRQHIPAPVLPHPSLCTGPSPLPLPARRRGRMTSRFPEAALAGERPMRRECNAPRASSSLFPPSMGPLPSVHAPARLFGPRAALRLRLRVGCPAHFPSSLLLHSAVAHRDGVQVRIPASPSPPLPPPSSPRHPRLVRSYMYTHTASITRQVLASHSMLLLPYSPCKPASVEGIGKLV